ncbi:hypothetical protein PAXRUDRAFT_238530 [Paxillus rubicundulus Ve08.2h10]|uniref:F-box domain-containing protein n=1 Tax=Paxillus rubicundulus Ve08.2h10 TaxID=930991 RepID=A0A0D0DGM5_9AGAM|nr:hypothetical protein PAXRUDRAFT_238530 [Paxillus rubicundulus Ve08.2h10]
MTDTAYLMTFVPAFDRVEEAEVLFPVGADAYIVNSMSPPREAEYLSAQHALAQDNAKLQLLNDGIEECQQRIARAHADMCILERQRNATQHLMSIHRARLSPLRILPDELLQEIFKRCLPDTHYVVPNIRSAPLVLTQVCRRWRVVAQGTSELWSSIALRDLGVWNYEFYVDMVKRWLSHVRTRPLRMSITCPVHTDFGYDSNVLRSDIFNLVTAHESQLRDLRLNVNRTYLHHFVNNTTLPALECILISLHPKSRIGELPQPSAPVFHSAPNLKNVAFEGDGTSTHIIPPSISQQISHLSFDCNLLLDFTLLFQDFPHLQQLTVKLSISPDTLRIRLPPREGDMVVAHSLQRFEVCLDKGLLDFGSPLILDMLFA